MPHSKRNSAQGLARDNASKQQPPMRNNKPHGVDSLPFDLLRGILGVFGRAFAADRAGDFDQTAQEIKGHLYRRDFAAAFSNLKYLETYALRWSAARALVYTEIFNQRERKEWICPRRCPDTVAAAATGQHDAFRVTCIGGGAGAEIVALACTSQLQNLTGKLDITAIDIADWQVPIDKLRESMTTPSPTSTRGDQTDSRTNEALIPAEKVDIRFLQADILAFGYGSEPESQQIDHHTQTELRRRLAETDLCTVMFTLNELFSASMAKTTGLLFNLTDVMVPGSHLVVVDSPGSYSEVQLGKEGKTKKYPMKWLLDHTLLTVANSNEPSPSNDRNTNRETNKKWEKVEDNDSTWFRLDTKNTPSDYPIDLENTRYQLHAYRRL